MVTHEHERTPGGTGSEGSMDWCILQTWYEVRRTPTFGLFCFVCALCNLVYMDYTLLIENTESDPSSRLYS